MTKFVGIVSAKGGVGKTTTTINLTSTLGFLRREVIALDANFANPDLGIHLGVPNVGKRIHSALKGEHHIKNSIYKHPSGIRIIPGNIAYKEAREAKRENLVNVIHDLLGTAEAVIIDSTPGLGRDSQEVIRASDYLLIVTTPDICSVTDSLKMIKLAGELKTQVLGVIVNKKRQEGYEMSEQNITEFLETRIVGVIPEDSKLRYCLQTKTPLINIEANSPTADSYKKLACELIGEKYVGHLENIKERSFFSQVMRNLGFSK